VTTLSVVVITLNEEHNIAACLDAVSWADEIIVLDSGSSDATVALASARQAQVSTRTFSNYGEQKNAALALATCDWVLSIDADERIPVELAEEMKRAIADPGAVVGFALPRRDFLLGRWIRHGLWWPQHKLRLIRRGHGKWQGKVHELLIADGPVRTLRAPMLHFSNHGIVDLVRDTNRYTTMEAEAWHAAGIRPSLWKMLLYPPALFAYTYIIRLGFLDGLTGLVLAFIMANYTFLKRAKLWELASEARDEH
jgi:glycosyltransferase involved in cell wall biosynthesis